MSAAPLFSVLTPVYATPLASLEACIASVRAQTFSNWEFVLVDDGSPHPEVIDTLNRAAARDPRIRVVARGTNGGIVAASNSGLEAARGTYMAFLDHDDELAPCALDAMAAAIAIQPAADVLYSDEDKLDERGVRYHTFRKPEWSPTRLRSQMYLGHLTVMRRSLVEEVGGFRADFEGSQDYDLALRVTERAAAIVHVPEVLYHWRALTTSIAHGHEAKPYAFAAAARAISEHCARIGLGGTVEQTHPSGIYRVRPPLTGNPLVSIVIPTRGSSAVIEGRYRTLVTGAVRSIVAKTTYDNYEIVIVADATSPVDVLDELTKVAGDRLRLVPYERPFNFSDKVNVGAIASSGEYLLLLNDDIEVISPDWIEAMLGPAQDTGVGMVGAMLYFSDGTIQHAGHCYEDGNPDHIGWRAPHGDAGYFRAFATERECSGVTGACALVRRDLFFTLGGFTLLLPNNFNDVDFSMKVRTAGKRIIWTPFAELFHYESKTRINTVTAAELDTMRRRWFTRMLRDPFWTRRP